VYHSWLLNTAAAALTRCDQPPAGRGLLPCQAIRRTPHIAGVTGDEVDATVNVELIAERLELVLIARGKRRRAGHEGPSHGIRGGPHVGLGHAGAVPTHEKELGSELGHGGTRARGENAAAPVPSVQVTPSVVDQNIIAVADDIRAADQPEAILEGDQGGRLSCREARGEWLFASR